MTDSKIIMYTTEDGLTKIEVTIPQVMRVMKLMEAIRRSAEERRIIDFEA